MTFLRIFIFVICSTCVLIIYNSTHFQEIYQPQSGKSRSSLKDLWISKNGPLNYTVVFTNESMTKIHDYRRKGQLMGNIMKISGPKSLKGAERLLEATVGKMFGSSRNTPINQFKSMSEFAWRKATSKLDSQPSSSRFSNPLLSKPETNPKMSNILVYNKSSKSGSTLLLSLLYKLRTRLGYMIIRGRYHSYRYFSETDRNGLGYFLETGSQFVRSVYVQHQFFINFKDTGHQQPMYVNLMRDPLEQFISWYYYKRSDLIFHRNHLKMTGAERALLTQSLEECVVEQKIECQYDGYTFEMNKTYQLNYRKRFNPDFFHPSDVLLHFCGHAPECLEFGNQKAVEIAIANVDTKFAAVGVLEMLEETGVVFENELPEYFTGLPALLKKEGIKNKATFKDDKLSSHVREEMKSRLQSEYQLYQHVVNKLIFKHAALSGSVGYV